MAASHEKIHRDALYHLRVQIWELKKIWSSYF